MTAETATALVWVLGIAFLWALALVVILSGCCADLKRDLARAESNARTAAHIADEQRRAREADAVWRGKS